MKILYLTNIPSPYRVDFFSELGKYCNLTVVYERQEASDRHETWYKNNKNNYTSLYLNGLNFRNDCSFSFKILKYINKDYDFIVIGGYSTPTAMLAITYLKFKGIPFILNVDGGFIKKDNKINYLIKRFFISSAKYYLSTGYSANEYLIHYGAKKDMIYNYPFTSLKKMDLLLESLSEDNKKKIRRDLGIKEAKVILTVGQYIPRKGFDLLIKSMLQYEDQYGVYIVGGKPTSYYQELKVKYNLNNLHFIDFCEKEKLKNYYKASDLFILPTREDIWGLVINEAMANGLPIITTVNCGAGLEMVQNGINGYIIDVDNHQQIANKVNLLFNNPNLLQSMSKNNMKKSQNYIIEKMAYEHFKIFKECKKNHKIRKD